MAIAKRWGKVLRWRKLRTTSPRERVTKKKRKQIGGFLPGLLGPLIANAIRKKQGKKPVNFNARKYMKGAIGRRIQVAKLAKGKKIPTPGNTGMSTKKFLMSGLFGVG